MARKVATAVLLTTCLMGIVGIASAHEVRPAYLELRIVGGDTVLVMWKVPARGDMRLSLGVTLPEHCIDITTRSRQYVSGSWIDRWTSVCAGGLVGSSISIDGLSSTLTDVLVRLERENGTTQVGRVKPSSPVFDVTETPGKLQVALTYLSLGVEHILFGIDHLLFVLALLIIVTGRRRLLGTITAFTLAHSITLVAATLGLLYVPQTPVEAVIALSIVFVASEIVHSRQGRPGITERKPWIVAFVFGLLHGFGFAGALTELGLPEQSIPVALLFFNVGVEVGQLMFIAAAFAVFFIVRPLNRMLPDWSWRIAPYVIGSLAAFWTIERVLAF
jgi:hydrogenase/urease accessory protein HupE